MGTYESDGVTSMCELQVSNNGVCVLVAVLSKLDEVCRGQAFSRGGWTKMNHDMDLPHRRWYVLRPTITQTLTMVRCSVRSQGKCEQQEAMHLNFLDLESEELYDAGDHDDKEEENIFRDASVGCEDNDALYYALYP